MAKEKNTKYRVKLNDKQISMLVMALVYIALGVLFIIFKGQILTWITYVIGALLIVKGVIDFVSYKLIIPAAVEISLGILAISRGAAVTQAVASIGGVMLVLYGLYNLFTQPKTIVSLVIDILTVVAGVLLMINTSGVIEWLFIVMGVIFIINGICEFLKIRK